MDNKTVIKISKYTLLTLVVYQILIGAGLGTYFILNPTGVIQEALSLTYVSDMSTLSSMIGSQMIFLAGVATIGFIQIRKNNTQGSNIGILIGAFAVLLALTLGILNDRPDALFIDGGRGLLMIISGVILRNHTTKQAHNEMAMY